MKLGRMFVLLMAVVAVVGTPVAAELKIGDTAPPLKIKEWVRGEAVNLTKDMGLRLCGVDLIVHGDIRQKPNRYWILEINSAPGLDHYVRTGKAQQKIVEDMYLQVLKSME